MTILIKQDFEPYSGVEAELTPETGVLLEIKVTTQPTLTLNPSPQGEGLQSGSPSPNGRRGWGMRASSTLS